jgi:hypothetical protein
MDEANIRISQSYHPGVDKHMRSKTSKEVNKQPVWVVCDLSAMNVLILLMITLERLNISTEKKGIDRDANDSPSFILIQLKMESMSLDELEQIVSKVVEVLNSNEDTEKRRLCIWGVWAPDFPYSP